MCMCALMVEYFINELINIYMNMFIRNIKIECVVKSDW